MQLDEELLALEAQLPYFRPGKRVDLDDVLKDEHAHVRDGQVQTHALVVLQKYTANPLIIAQRNAWCLRFFAYDIVLEINPYHLDPDPDLGYLDLDTDLGGVESDSVQLYLACRVQQVEVRLRRRLASAAQNTTRVNQCVHSAEPLGGGESLRMKALLGTGLCKTPHKIDAAFDSIGAPMV